MAFSTGSASDFADLLSDLSTFLTANGWTQDELDTSGGDFAFSKNSIYVSGRWEVGNEGVFSLHQATAFDGTGTLPGDHTGDSGNGYNDTTSHSATLLDNERHVDLESDGPYPTYWFFENDASPAYVHVVVEFETDKFAHFGFGEILKTGDWTGGEYCYGNYHVGTNNGLNSSTWLLDGFFNDTGTDARRAATMRMTGIPDQPVGSVWAQVWGRDTSAPDDDAANDKAIVCGGYRSGPLATHLGQFSGSGSDGLVPGYPVGLWFIDGDVSLGGVTTHFLGYQSDVRGVNIRNFAPGDIIDIGGEQWYVFPARLRDTSVVTGATGYMGIMYRREDA
jgi:hypothetical protein